MVHLIKRRNIADGAAIPAFEVNIPGLDALLRQKLCHTANIAVYRHAVVIKDNDNRLIASSDICKPLIGQSARECTVANHGNNIVFFFFQCSRPCHSERERDGIRCVTCDERIIRRLIWFWEARYAAVAAQGIKAIPAAGDDFMSIALMPDIENDPVSRAVVHSVQCNGELDCS